MWGSTPQESLNLLTNPEGKGRGGLEDPERVDQPLHFPIHMFLYRLDGSCGVGVGLGLQGKKANLSLWLWSAALLTERSLASDALLRWFCQGAGERKGRGIVLRGQHQEKQPSVVGSRLRGVVPLTRSLPPTASLPVTNHMRSMGSTATRRPLCRSKTVQ